MVKTTRNKRKTSQAEKPRILRITAIAVGVLAVFAIIYLVSTFRQVTVSPGSFLDKDVIRVQVLNGCGVPDLATRVGDKVRDISNEDITFDVVEVKNAPVFGFERTLVVSRRLSPEAAELIARELSLDDMILTERLTHNPLEIDVTVVVGSDYKELGI
ncbi:MAG: hypothetical protein GF307_04695 [candidate division Zixibacteria bacterium]|nr:hypothetical protein [candidate division Zixibacteria bacterium]